MAGPALQADPLPRPAEARALIASDRVEGTAVRRPDGERLGTIDRLMIEKVSGRVVYAVMSFGGFLGLGEGHYTLPWSTLRFDTALDAYVLDLSEEELRGAPRRDDEGRDPALDRGWEGEVHRYYRTAPYWGI